MRSSVKMRKDSAFCCHLEWTSSHLADGKTSLYGPALIPERRESIARRLSPEQPEIPTEEPRHAANAPANAADATR